MPEYIMIFSLGLRASSCIRVCQGVCCCLHLLFVASPSPVPRLLGSSPVDRRPCALLSSTGCALLSSPLTPSHASSPVAGFVIAGDTIIGFSIAAPDQSDSSSLSSVFPLRRRAILPLFLPALSPVRRGFLSPSSIVFVAGASRITAAPDFAP
ncbi:hypothetical protein ACLOJK_012865 [Asimina triloba]